MPSKNPTQRLQDILENINAVREFTSGLNQESFLSNRMTVYAVTRALEIISEASRRLPADLKARHPELDWTAIAAAGNIYRHEYETVDQILLWNTVRSDLDVLETTVPDELRRLGVASPFANIG
jgi:uncharacterized protein with HEPN domain